MLKSQNRKIILFLLILFSITSISYPGICDDLNDRLALADSLFNQKKYTQSFDLYSEIYATYDKVSPAMLLKMAFVKEGLGDYANALYYLNLYYLKTYDKKVLKKMENLAEEHSLSGYEYDDAEFFLNIYQRYQLQIDLLVISLVLLIFGILFYQKRKLKQLSPFTSYSYIALLVLLFILNNFAREQQKAIISTDKAYLMKGPSPGADVVDIISYGHRVSILGHQDVWVEISWDNKSVYVKEFNLKPISL